MVRKSQLLGLSLLVAAIALTLGLGWISAGGKAETYVIDFERGVRLADGAAGQIDAIAGRLLSDESLEAVIVGHTGTIGDAGANRELSRERAGLVARKIEEAGVNAARLAALGVGGATPLTRRDGEADRAYQRRLARVSVEVSVALP